MYGQSHLKRILPRKEEQHYRTEFPSHYYSSSSVYSYSPTSSSDCPEHGRSHRRTKIILTLSVTFATLGVLSIAGVAIYLGFLSKNINHGSQSEETYLYSTAVNPKVSSSQDVEDLYQMPNGRSRSDFYPDDPVDLTNRIEEPIISNHPPQDPYLNTKHTATQVIFSQRNASSPYQNKFPSLIQGPDHRPDQRPDYRPDQRPDHRPDQGPGPTAIPSPVVVSSEKTKTPPPPIDLQSPLIILGPKRNTSTSSNQPTRSNERVTVHFEQEDSTIHPKLNATNSQEKSRRPSTAAPKPKAPFVQTQSPVPSFEKVNKATVAIGTVFDNDQQNHHENDPKNLGPILAKGSAEDKGPKSTLNIPVPPSTVPPTQLRPSTNTHDFQNSDVFYPVVNPVVNLNYQISANSEPNPGNLVANHRVHLTFDRISPEFYDKKPWTPLLIRPNQGLDKRPRVEVPEVSSFPPGSHESQERYYEYGGAGVDNLKIKPQEPQGDLGENNGHLLHVDRDPIVHGDGHYPISSVPHEVEELVFQKTLERTPIHYVATDDQRQEIPAYVATDDRRQEIPAYVATDDRRQQIPAYTVTIPHIPNDSNMSMITNRDFLSLVNEAKENRMGTGGAEILDELPETGGAEMHKPMTGTGAGAEIGDATGAGAYGDEEEYEEDGEEDEEVDPEKSPGQTRVYTLDPMNVDMFPQPIEIEAPLFELTKDITNSGDPTQENSANTSAHLESDENPSVKSEKDDQIVKSEENEQKVKSEQKEQIVKSEENEQKVKSEQKEQKVKSEQNEQIVKSEQPIGTESSEVTATEEIPQKSTTDFILSSLGSLNLVKAPKRPLPLDGLTTHEGNLPEMKGVSLETPLFPPTRSYISVHLPLREKPESESEEDGENSEEKIFLVTDNEKKLRLVNGEGQPLAPDLTSTSSLNKVLSMMMTFEDTNPEGVLNLLKNNVQLIVSNHTGFDNNQKVEGHPISSFNFHNKSREHKSFTRDPKIDSRFRDPEMEKIPVLLVHTAPGSNSKSVQNPDENKTWIPTKISSLTPNKHNSPVYKFVLRKGQSVEDLLKEIFKNYTDKGIGIGNTTRPESVTNNFHSQSEILEPDPLPLGIQLATKFHVLDHTTKTPVTTTTGSSTLRMSTTSRMSTTTPATSTIDSVFKTSTSVVINEEIQEASMPNGTFKCASTGVILSAFARCNSIKECPDNSDEKNCKCVDYLKSQLLHRKICDGIVDCADESDESYCDWCTPGQYICSGSRVCVSREKICDSRRDCPRGDDESNCVKIGPSGHVDDLEDISPIYHQSGYLMVRKRGIWGKLCVETFSSVLSHWEIKDLARAVCKAKTFSDFESVEKVVDDHKMDDEPYYELYNSINDTDSIEKLYSSDEATPRSAIGFKVSKCATRMVVKVKCSELQCGTAPRAFTQAARIVGGSNALPGGWPWQAALYRDGEYQCGATLISGRWLLSAGHCFYHAQDDYWVARLGTLRRGATFLSPYEQVIKITHIFLHPQYKDIGFVNDVSLLRLEKEVNFTDFVRPVCLPEKDTKIKDGRICTVVGWGQLFETGRVFPDTLQEVQLPLISTSECRKRTLFLPLYKLTDEMFCAGFDRGGRDACLGDSGGPLMCPETDGRWSLYGVTSNGYGCARANRPGVYTKTKSYLDWVYDKISQDSSFTYRDKTKRCSGHRCLLGECLEPRSVCNGIADCVDGSDERNCSWS